MPAAEGTLRSLRERLDKIVNEDHLPKLVRPGLGDLNFESAIPLLEMLISMFRVVHGSDLKALPQAAAQAFNDKAGQLLVWLQEVERFRLDRTDSLRHHRNLITQLDQMVSSDISSVGGYISYLVNDQTAFQERMAELQSNRDETERIVGEAQAALGAVRGIAGEAGVEKHSSIFGEQATTDSAAAGRWLVWAGVLGGVSLAWILGALWILPPSTETLAKVIGELGGRFAILTLLLFALGFALRQYASSKHNQTVNLHRQNALRTFKTFVSAADDPEIRDAVLLEAARSIFVPQSSGFLRGRQETESPSMLVEVIRRIGSTSSNKSQSQTGVSHRF
ncbi:MAG: hypothetical protein OXM62_03165 [bacterium]|nr:hypothetical protein [bacterium]MDE0233986.1 hypothetical protein [bacterium]